MIKDKNIFITGGAGFIGSALVGQLIEHNKICIYDNLTRNSLKNKSYCDHPNLTLIEGDILNFEKLQSAMKNSNIVVHCAAIAGIDTVIKKPISTMKVNMIGTANVLESASKLKNCERVVCFSTSEVFGSYAFKSEETDNTVMGKLGEARWTYAVSKLASEHLAIAYYHEMNLPVTVIRPFNIYGPGQVGEGAMSIFIQNAIYNKSLNIHGDGTQIRAWCYIDDMINGLLLTMEHPKAIGESFNIGNQKAVITIYGLANTIIRVLNSKSHIKFSKKHYTDIELRVPVVKKAHKLLGFEAKINMEEGIKRTATYFRGF